MVAWLKDGLAANPEACTLAYFHHPLFSSGEHGNQIKMRPVWDALYAADAEVVLNGHDYERFAHQLRVGVCARGWQELHRLGYHQLPLRAVTLKEREPSYSLRPALFRSNFGKFPSRYSGE